MAVVDLIGSSVRFRAVLNEIRMVAPLDSAVLIQGETGTGKGSRHPGRKKSERAAAGSGAQDDRRPRFGEGVSRLCQGH